MYLHINVKWTQGHVEDWINKIKKSLLPICFFCIQILTERRFALVQCDAQISLLKNDTLWTLCYMFCDFLGSLIVVVFVSISQKLCERVILNLPTISLFVIVQHISISSLFLKNLNKIVVTRHFTSGLLVCCVSEVWGWTADNLLITENIVVVQKPFSSQKGNFCYCY